ncbi:MAG: trypsin-like peptidase domain-containing protein [Raineya sp.]
MINKKQFLLSILLAAMLGAAFSLIGLRWLLNRNYVAPPKITYQFKDTSILVPEGLNFIYSSEIAVPAVVHIKTSYSRRTTSHSNDPMEDMFRQFHGKSWTPRSSSGSGVLISEDGYIVTNNHVIENTELIEVTLHDKRRYEARLIGSDPSTDLALLKIEELHLPYLRYANSDQVRIGEWVLAVGNPFDLNSTVTAGIISAKARNINLIQDKDNLQVESFLQTDASVNPGNSGGALVNLKGELVGVNTAIASETGTFQGYSFAVPANLVKKVIEDLQKYGEVQRALMGIEIVEINADVAKDKKLPSIEGVYIAKVNINSGAAEAGIEPGDVVLEIDNKRVNSRSELQAIVASKRPGDKIAVLFRRGDIEKKAIITLKNPQGSTQLIQKTTNKTVQVMGAELVNASEAEKSFLGIKGGAKILRIGKGKFAEIGVQKGFMITHISQSGKRIAIQSAAHVLAITQQADKNGEGLYLEGMYENGDKAYYPIGW